MTYSCEKKKSLHRLLGLMLVLSMVCALFAGCAFTDPKDPSTEPPVGPNIVDPTDEQTSPEGPATTPTSNSGEDKTNIAIVQEQVNYRSSPGSTGNVLGQFDAGQEVEVIQRFTVGGKGWSRVQWNGTNQGWVPDASMDMSNVDIPIDSPDTPASTNPTEPDATEPEPTDAPSTDNPAHASGSKGVVITNELNVRSEPSTSSDRVASLTYGTRVTITETKDGWGKMSKGWISLKYVYMDGDRGTNGCTGVITGTTLNVRSGPGTNYDKVSSLSKGDKVTVLQRIDVGKTQWGYVAGGWICMDYVDVDGETNNNNTNNGSNNNTNNNGGTSNKGTVTAGTLYVRSGPGTDYDQVGSLSKGDKVTILETSNGWGRISDGWISLKYVKMG